MSKQSLSQRNAGRPPDSEKRERLLDAAIALFSERGIANTTVAQIATRCRVTPAMVHYWFDTREKLLDAVAEERLLPHIIYVWSPSDTKQEAPLELVQGLVARMLAVTKEMPWLPSLWLREIVQEGGLLRERVLNRIPRDRIAAFRRRISAAQSRGEINRHLSPDLLFISILGLVMLPQAAAKTWRRVSPDITAEYEQLERHIMGLLMFGVAGSPPVRTARPRRSKE